MTLNGHYALLFKIYAFSEPTTKIGIKVLSARKMQPMTLVSDNIRFMRIFAGVRSRGASNDSGKLTNYASRDFVCCLNRFLV